jgi:hypothetical protein
MTTEIDLRRHSGTLAQPRAVLRGKRERHRDNRLEQKRGSRKPRDSDKPPRVVIRNACVLFVASLGGEGEVVTPQRVERASQTEARTEHESHDRDVVAVLPSKPGQQVGGRNDERWLARDAATQPTRTE